MSEKICPLFGSNPLEKLAATSSRFSMGPGRAASAWALGLALVVSPLAAQEPVHTLGGPATQVAPQLTRHDEAKIEKKIMDVLTDDQRERFLAGEEASGITLDHGESLATYIDRLERSYAAGLVFKPISPCLLLDTRASGLKLVDGEAQHLWVRGENRGGVKDHTPACDIPGMRGDQLKSFGAKALFLDVEVFASEGPGELRLRPAETGHAIAHPLKDAAAENGATFTYGAPSKDSRVASGIGQGRSLVVAMCDEESANPCQEGDLRLEAFGGATHATVRVVGYFESLEKTQTVFDGSIRIESPTDPNDVLFVGSNTTYSFVNSWDGATGSARDLYLNGSVGIKTVSPQADLHITGGTGSSELLLEADTANSNEAAQPKVTLSQDGGLVLGQLGFFDSTNHLQLKNSQGQAKIVLRNNGDICLGKNC